MGIEALLWPLAGLVLTGTIGFCTLRNHSLSAYQSAESQAEDRRLRLQKAVQKRDVEKTEEAERALILAIESYLNDLDHLCGIVRSRSLTLEKMHRHSYKTLIEDWVRSHSDFFERGHSFNNIMYFHTKWLGQKEDA